MNNGLHQVLNLIGYSSARDLGLEINLKDSDAEYDDTTHESTERLRWIRKQPPMAENFIALRYFAYKWESFTHPTNNTVVVALYSALKNSFSWKLDTKNQIEYDYLNKEIAAVLSRRLGKKSVYEFISALGAEQEYKYKPRQLGSPTRNRIKYQIHERLEQEKHQTQEIEKNSIRELRKFFASSSIRPSQLKINLGHDGRNLPSL